MSRVNSLDEIDRVQVHWSESECLNDVLGDSECDDIEAIVTPSKLDELISKAGKLVSGGYDKTCLTVTLKDQSEWCSYSKFYLSRNESGLLSLLNKGEE